MRSNTIHQNKTQACWKEGQSNQKRDRMEKNQYKHTIMKHRTRCLHIRWDSLGDVSHVIRAQLAVLGQGGDAPTKAKS